MGRSAISLAWLVGFGLFFLSFDLPNNRPATRWQVWQQMPSVLLTTAWPLPDPNAPPAGWRYLPQRLPAMSVAAAILLAALGYGSLVLRRLRIDAELSWPEQIAIAGGVGLSLWSLATLGLGLAGWQHPAIVWGLIVLGIVAGLGTARSTICSLRIASPPLISALPLMILLLAGIMLWAMLLGACTPQTDFDVLAYHLNGPKEWFLRGRIEFLPHNVYTSFPFLTEMLLLSGMTALGNWNYGALAGQMVLMSFAPLTALALFGAGRRWFGNAAGWLAAMVWLTTPWTYRISIIAYAEGGLSFYLVASFFAACRAATATPQRSSWIGLTGFLAGSAMACKYTGLTMVVVPIGLGLAAVMIRQRMTYSAILKSAGIYLLGVLLAVGPWLIKNAVETGNPVYPLGYAVFGGCDLDGDLYAKWSRGHAAKSYGSLGERATDFVRKFTDVVANNDWHSPLLYGLAPLSLWWIVRRRDTIVSPLAPASGERGRALHTTGNDNVTSSADGTIQTAVLIAAWFYLAWLFLTWFVLTHHIDRFWVPMIPIVSLLAGAGAATFFAPIGRVVSGLIIAALIGFTLAICSLIGGYNAGLTDLRAAERVAANAMTPEIRWLNEEWQAGRLPPDFKLLCVGEAATYHAQFPVLYNSVFDRCLLEEWCATSDGSLRSADEIRRHFHDQGVTHVYINWRWVATYREPGNYGFTDFVHPDRMRDLQVLRVFGPELRLPEQLAFAPLKADQQQFLKTWAPGLIVRHDGIDTYRAAQVFRLQ